MSQGHRPPSPPTPGLYLLFSTSPSLAHLHAGARAQRPGRELRVGTLLQVPRHPLLCGALTGLRSLLPCCRKGRFLHHSGGDRPFSQRSKCPLILVRFLTPHPPHTLTLIMSCHGRLNQLSPVPARESRGWMEEVRDAHFYYL